MWVTADCTDPDFDTPIIDEERDVAEPIAHHRISGHFDGTELRFAIYLPAKDRWRGRFFQSVYPLDDEKIAERSLRFAASSGAYAVQTNSSSGYRGDAAAAKFARDLARGYYGTSDKIYGYVWGGSGGSYQTIAAMENTDGIWDGAVPFIVGDPSSIPNNFFSRVLARLVLGDAAASIADAVAPGGSGDPFMGLDDAEAEVLRELTALGLPLRAWEDYPYVLGLDAPDGLLGFAARIKQLDPGYVADFWTAPGYLGSEDTPLGRRLAAMRVRHESTITGVHVDARSGSTMVEFADLPDDGYDGPVDASLMGTTASAPMTGVLDRRTGTVKLDSAAGADLQVGSRVRIDNSWYVAVAAYARYQVPLGRDFHGYDQYRMPDGTARPPQRSVLAGATISQMVSGGGVHTGDIRGKVIAVSNLLDADAFPLHGDWYATQVDAALGDRLDDQFRLWFTDGADHTGARTPRLLDYTGVLERALLDVSAWAENGVPPPPSTRYRLDGGQVVVPRSAADRRGVQATVDLAADGRQRVDVAVGQPVDLTARFQLPNATDRIAELAWDDEGSGNFVEAPDLPPQDRSTVERRVSFPRPGIYYPALRVTLDRDGDDRESTYAHVPSLSRVRVVVRP